MHAYLDIQGLAECKVSLLSLGVKPWWSQLHGKELSSNSKPEGIGEIWPEAFNLYQKIPPAMYQKCVIPVSTESCWGRKVILTAGQLAWADNPWAEILELVPRVMCTSVCMSLLWVHGFFSDYSSASRHVLLLQFFFQVVVALLRAVPMKTGWRSTDFCRTSLDLMHLSLYAFMSWFQDDSWMLVKILGSGKRRKRKKHLKSESEMLPTSMSFE